MVGRGDDEVDAFGPTDLVKGRHERLLVLDGPGVELLRPDVLVVHCILMTARELAIWKEHDVKVSHTPMSNMLGGSGVAPVVDIHQDDPDRVTE